ncbi:MAG: DUF2520 domain-containing protein [Nitriliruptorales bacterium]|nr:DUF2520 domain-containing protein [Nitriliruptorales bacterium]
MIRVAILGPGRVGTTLALALPRPAYEVVAVAGRGEAGLRAFRGRVPAAVALPAEKAALQADLVLVTVNDDALTGLVRAVAAADGVAEGSRWVHTSGGHGHEVLEPVRLAGAAVAACHPAQTFPDPDAGLAALPGCSWAVTANAEDLGWARVLVTDLRGSPITVETRNRTLYHAGLAVGSNATASVVTFARDLLLGAGVSDPNAFLGPLVTTSVRGAAAHGAAALTGPVRRGDVSTLDRHLEELSAVLPEAVEHYVALARMALGQARRAGLDPKRADAVARRLDDVRGHDAAGGPDPSREPEDTGEA